MQGSFKPNFLESTDPFGFWGLSRYTDVTYFGLHGKKVHFTQLMCGLRIEIGDFCTQATYVQIGCNYTDVPYFKPVSIAGINTRGVKLAREPREPAVTRVPDPFWDHLSYLA